ncbi:DUF3307 domain-containing protein [Tenacibaculum sp. AHE15PA]|uniref:DUF3307 domain-containing protein n=1 Tax=unclassified Tenacibaculum TaxID=2635139 RepID=UPI001C4F5762|nr:MULTISPECIES: DUF3307 domain-containing protein [unclassified Tenacibaculum]QXP73941.1 DUF3307 domain-containing protein [Tenacibaculum sp. AHE14PA]QXP75692.1 DUF3307 domain-containing protein [Tenacibaculum sp. AHE15PA]
MILFLKFLIAHFLGDFIFQSEKWVKNKEKKKIKSKKLYLHITVHLLLLLIMTSFSFKYILGVFFITTTHYLIDLSKLYLQHKKNKTWLFFIGQFLHILMLALVTYWYFPYRFNIDFLFSLKALLLISCLIFVSFVASIIIQTIISQWSPEKEFKKEDDSLAKAGKYIGILERLLIFTFIVIGQWAGVGFLLAAKSIFRFGDLTSAKDRKLTEYILIGTLLSFGLAILTGLVYSHYGR